MEKANCKYKLVEKFPEEEVYQFSVDLFEIRNTFCGLTLRIKVLIKKKIIIPYHPELINNFRIKIVNDEFGKPYRADVYKIVYKSVPDIEAVKI